MDFAGKVAMVTGAGGSLGKAVATALGAAGAALVLIDVDQRQLAAAYPGKSARRLCLALDLTDATAVKKAVKTAIGKLGRIDILCNIAGGFRMGPAVHETPAETWKLMMDMNAITMLHSVQAVVPHMIAAGSGKIVNVGAGAGQKGLPRIGAYAASKSVVIRLTESMGGELRERNINVNCVLPSTIDTPQNRKDMPDADPSRWVSLHDLAEVILFLCSEKSRAIHGAAIAVVGLS